MIVRERVSATSLATLARFARAARARGEGVVLAHLVAVDGSHYRRPGARMIFAGDGSTAGSISGGCLEADLAEKCAAVLAEGRPHLVAYDLRRSDDLVWGTGLGCAGRIEILLSPLPDARLLERAAADGGGLVVATSLESGELDLGEQALLCEGRIVEGSARLADAVARGDRPDSRVLSETVEPAVRLLVGGAGPDVVPLASAARALGWDVRLFAPRPTERGRMRFDGFAFHAAAEIAAHADARTAAVVATHNYFDDLDLLRSLLPTAAPYLGLLGARGRAARLMADCRDVLGVLASGGASRVFGPSGLDLGADAPEEIALSIVAEIQAVFRGRSGRPLREGSSGIHDRQITPVDNLQER